MIIGKYSRGFGFGMTSEETITKIRNQITAYQLNVKSDNKANRYNINDRAESFTIPLFKLIFSWEELEDLNLKQKNFPGIDLGDYSKRVAVQVTSQTTLEKVKDTLTTFIENNLYQNFDRVVIFMIQVKQKNYNKSVISNICDGKVKFSVDEDIIDLTDLLNFIKGFSLKDLEVILRLFEDETGYVDSPPEINNKKVNKNEKILKNKSLCINFEEDERSANSLSEKELDPQLINFLDSIKYIRYAPNLGSSEDEKDLLINARIMHREIQDLIIKLEEPCIIDIDFFHIASIPLSILLSHFINLLYWNLSEAWKKVIIFTNVSNSQAFIIDRAIKSRPLIGKFDPEFQTTGEEILLLYSEINKNSWNLIGNLSFSEQLIWDDLQESIQSKLGNDYMFTECSIESLEEDFRIFIKNSIIWLISNTNNYHITTLPQILSFKDFQTEHETK